ncbi:monocarboxylate transporter 12-like [Pecten maximus]|uniref:monocarboxylate transporter 12-like n=1 Tax=Pecten maximus TaxID=6579 RepID=UPI0014581540|nr:monocarboxylate transporter 12-like [Pecten maximus]
MQHHSRMKAVEQSVGDTTDETSDCEKSVQPPDGGRGWVVTISSFFICMVVDGVNGIFGIFYPELLSAFGGSKGKTQISSSAMFGTLLVLAPVSGVLMEKYGHRKVAICGGLISSTGLFLSTFSPNLDVMILLYGFVGGFGMALLYPTSLVVVGMYFEKRRALATGIAVSGSGIGTLVFAPLSEILLETYGWRGTIWLMSAVVLNTVVCGSFYRPIGRQESMTAKSETTKKNCILNVFDLSLLTYPVFILHAFSGFLYSIAYNIPLSYLPAQAKFVEISSQESALLISIIGISGTISRILIGYISDKRCVNTLVLNSTMLMIGGLATCFVPYYTTFSALSLYSATYGAVAATFVSVMTINLVKLMGLQNLPRTLGLYFLCMGIGSFIGSPVAGALSETSRNYNNAFYFGGVAMGLAGLVSLPLTHLANRKQNRTADINGFTNRSFTLEQITSISLKSLKHVSYTST